MRGGAAELAGADTNDFHPDLEQMRARGDVEAAIVGGAEGHVGGADASARLTAFLLVV